MSALLLIPWFKLEGLNIPGTQLGIQPFGILVAIGVLSGARMAEWRGVRLGIKREVISDCILHVVGIAFVLGHVFDMIFYTPERLVEAPWELLFFWKSLSSYGGFFGSAIGGLYWRFRRGYPLTPVYDQIAFGLSLGWFFGRLGCFVVHDHPGKVSNFFLAVDNFQYPGLATAPRHDLGLYEVIWSAFMIPLFFWLDRKPRPHGFFIGLITILYAPVRFGLDFLRDADKLYLGLTPGHYSSLLAFGLGVWMMWRAYNRPVTKLPAGMLTSADTQPAKG